MPSDWGAHTSVDLLDPDDMIVCGHARRRDSWTASFRCAPRPTVQITPWVEASSTLRYKHAETHRCISIANSGTRLLQEQRVMPDTTFNFYSKAASSVMGLHQAGLRDWPCMVYDTRVPSCQLLSKSRCSGNPSPPHLLLLYMRNLVSPPTVKL